MAHPGGAGDFAKGADMRQAGGAIAGFEQHKFRLFAGRGLFFHTGQEAARLFKGPRLGGKRLISQIFRRIVHASLGLFLSDLKGRES